MARRRGGAPKAKASSRQPAATEPPPHGASAAISHRRVVFVLLAAVVGRWAFEHGWYDRVFEWIQVRHRRRPTAGSPTTVGSSSSASAGDDEDAHRRMSDFLAWFEGMGGVLSPNVTLGSFLEFGGHGLMAAVPQSAAPPPRRDGSDGYAVRHMDDMFTVPMSIITSARSVVERYIDLDPSFRGRIEPAVRRSFPSTMVQQDVIIALSLMAECYLGGRSDMEPYLRILPPDVPRLDTFSDDELELLQDPQLAALARQSKRQLSYAWENGGLRELSGLMSAAAARGVGIESMARTDVLDDSCLTFGSFHRYVAIASSRAMVLGGIKHLAPLADMANYSPRNDNRTAGLSESFMLYHHRGQDGSITVRADRNVEPGSQIFEDYGDTDNSLYLEAHGFVPDKNPFHCAMVSAEHVPQPSSLPRELVDAMVGLGILPRGPSDAPDVCITAQGTTADARAGVYLKVANLAGNDAQLRNCVGASLTGDTELATLQCTRYEGHRRSLERTVRELARHAYCNATSTAEEDMMLLNAGKDEMQPGSVRRTTALKFRLAEKLILSAAAESPCSVDVSGIGSDDNSSDEAFDLADNDGTRHETRIEAEEQSRRLEDFVAFLDSSLEMPVKKIKPAFVGNGMRLGAVATEDLAKGETYLSIAADSSVISIDTAIVKEEEPTIQPLLDKYRDASDDGGFRALLLFLLHEKFVAKEGAKFFPYFNLLPNVLEMKKSHPLFFEEDRLDYLSGSDLRMKIIRYQRTAAKVYSEISSDSRVVRSLGADVALDREKVFWACAILDSRSIWWNGKRHLVPLLDLVNCQEVLDDEGKSNDVHHTAIDESGRNAVTKSTANVKSGDQVYENYGQPNYIYFMYHGFILDSNMHDCALWDGLSISSTDHVVKDMDRLRSRLASNRFNQSMSATFCIRADEKSLGRVADFLRIKLGIEGDNVGLDNDILDEVKEAVAKRLRRYEHLASLPNRDLMPYAERTMIQIVENEKSHFDRAMMYLESRE